MERFVLAAFVILSKLVHSLPSEEEPCSTPLEQDVPYEIVDSWTGGAVVLVDYMGFHVPHNATFVAFLTTPISARITSWKTDFNLTNNNKEIHLNLYPQDGGIEQSFSFVMTGLDDKVEVYLLIDSVMLFTAPITSTKLCLEDEMRRFEGSSLEDKTEDNYISGHPDLFELAYEDDVEKLLCTPIKSQPGIIGFYTSGNIWTESYRNHRFEGFIKFVDVELNDWKLELIFDDEINEIELWNAKAEKKTWNVWLLSPMSHNRQTNTLQFNFLARMPRRRIPKAFVHLCSHVTYINANFADLEDPSTMLHLF